MLDMERVSLAGKDARPATIFFATVGVSVPRKMRLPGPVNVPVAVRLERCEKPPITIDPGSFRPMNTVASGGATSWAGRAKS